MDCGLNLSGSGYGYKSGCCEHGSLTASPIKDTSYLNQMNDSLFSQQDCFMQLVSCCTCFSLNCVNSTILSLREIKTVLSIKLNLCIYFVIERSVPKFILIILFRMSSVKYKLYSIRTSIFLKKKKKKMFI